MHLNLDFFPIIVLLSHYQYFNDSLKNIIISKMLKIKYYFCAVNTNQSVPCPTSMGQ